MTAEIASRKRKFAEMSNTSESGASGTRAAKVGHKKSRLGCQRCKTRRVKCDEKKPICSSCDRHGAECIYVEPRATLVSPNESSDNVPKQRRRSQVSVRSTKKSPSPTSELFPRTFLESDDLDLPETKARRLMELRLAQNSLMNIAPSSAQHEHSEWLHMWRDILPGFMLAYDSVLYASHAVSATHLLRTNRDDEALYSARQNYFVLALREQRKQVADINTENADAVCLTSILILFTSFGMMEERSLTPYNPPVEWLKMGRGAGAVFWKANNAVPANFPAVFKSFIATYPFLGSDHHLNGELEPPFATIYHTMSDHNGWDTETQLIYRRTLAYISTLQKSIDEKEATFLIGRRVQAFPMIIPNKFADLVQSHDICALIVLAHYFGVVAQMPDDAWWRQGENEVDGTAVREIQAINLFIPPDWRALMQWPLSKLSKSI